MVWVELVTALALVQFIVFGILVGKARGKYGIKAPATTGNEIFERYNRVHLNTLELLVVFLPALWMATRFSSPALAAGLGAVYLIGRIIYLKAYVANPGSRSLGYSLSMLPVLALILITLFGIVRTLVAG